MSSFLNGNGQTSSSMADALSKWQGSQTGDQSGLGNALLAGTSGTQGGDSYQFQLPSDVTSAVNNDTSVGDMAGLTGVQSGMTMPDFSNAVSGSGNYNFAMPSGVGGGNAGSMQGAIAAGDKLKQGLTSNTKPPAGGTGRVTMQAKDFSAPVVALPMASGSAAGNSLLQMMQRYQPGNTVGQNTGSGYGMR